MYRSVLVVTSLSISLLGKYIEPIDVDKELGMISLPLCSNYPCVANIEQKIQAEQYTIKEKDGQFLIQIVNIKDKKQFELLKAKYQKEYTFGQTQEPKKVQAPVIASIPKEYENKKILEDYTQALTLYKQKKYQDSYIILNNLFEQNLDDANINFYLGRSAFEMKKYHDAIIAFERILFSNPESSRTKLELARAYFITKQYGEAKKRFLEVQEDTNVPQNIRDAVAKFLLAIENSTKKHFLNGIVLFGLNYDSNVKNTALPHNLGTTLSSTNEEISDWAHQEVAIINHKYLIDETSSFKNDILLFAKTMNNHKNSDNDIKMISYTPTLNILYEKGLSIDYSIFTDALWIDDKSYLRTYGIMPKFTYTLKKDLIYDGYLKLQDKNFQKPDDAAKDSRYLELQGGAKYLFDKTATYSGSFTYAQERKDSGAQTDVDKDSYSIKLSATYLASQKISLAPSLSYKNTYYKEKSTFANQSYDNRKDNEYKIALMSTYVYSEQWLYQLSGDYMKNRSNNDANSYNKNTFTFNLIRLF